MHTSEHKPEPSLGFKPIDTSNLKTGDVITSSDLASVSSPVITPATPLSTPSVSTIPVTEPTAESTKEPINPFIKSIEDLQIDILGKESEKAAQIGTATGGFREQLLDVNKQLRAQQLQAMKDEETALQRGETLGFASGEAARVARNNAFETFRLSSLSEALQGNITFAESQAEKAINVKYAEKEKQLRIARQNLIDNYDSLTPAQKKRADATLLAIDKEDAFVKQEKADQKEAQLKTLEYVGVADTKTLDQMSKATSALEVAQIAQSKGLTLKQNTFEQRLDPQGNLIELELDPQGRVIKQRVISKKEIVDGGVDGGKEVKPPTSAQRLAAGYAARLTDSNKIITEIGSKFTGFISRLGARLPQGLKTDDRQRFEQAQRNFINAVLRRESGAAIAESEFESARLQYFPQPGDSSAVLTQKRQNRELVARAMQLEAGSAFEELAGSALNLFDQDELSEINNIFGNTQTTTSSSFNPAQYFK
jgi:hypothetical protein